ncbi:MAG: hypothetical protein ACOX7I_00835 [Oscillospiraceae bacterium]|jgi:hypothetical protein
MNIADRLVIHKTFGEGKVVDHAGGYLSILFSQGEKRFVYPDSFKEFLRAKDETLNAAIQNELAEAQAQNLTLQREKEHAALLGREKTAEKRFTQTKPKERVYPRANISFKCNFCDGGKSSERVGFRGVCSEGVIRYNIKEKNHVWCSSPDSPCRQYYDGIITSYSELEDMLNEGGQSYICYESAMLRDWRAFAGVTQTGENKGRPMRLKQVQINSLAVLTTRLPYEPEENRFIFAVFLVDDTYEGDTREEGYVSTDSRYKIQMTPNEAQKLKFWNYYSCPNAPDVVKFGSGLHRYLSDEQAAQILRDIAELKRGTAQEALAREFLDYFCKVNGINIESVPQNSGALMSK